MSLLQSPINTGTLFEPLLTTREAAPFLRFHYTEVPAITKVKKQVKFLKELRLAVAFVLDVAPM